MISVNLICAFCYLFQEVCINVLEHRHFPANGSELEKSVCFCGLIYWLDYLLVASEQTLWR
jgi:hypothetical protein